MIQKYFKRSTSNFDKKLLLIDLAMIICLAGFGFMMFRLIISVINY